MAGRVAAARPGRRWPRAAASGRPFHHGDRQVLADQRPIGCSNPDVPLEITEFYSANLVGDREGAMSTYGVEKLLNGGVGLRS